MLSPETAARVTPIGQTGYTGWAEFIAEANARRRDKGAPCHDAEWYLGREVEGVTIVAADPATRTVDLADGRVLPMHTAWRLLA